MKLPVGNLGRKWAVYCHSLARFRERYGFSLQPRELLEIKNMVVKSFPIYPEQYSVKYKGQTIKCVYKRGQIVTFLPKDYEPPRDRNYWSCVCKRAAKEKQNPFDFLDEAAKNVLFEIAKNREKDLFKYYGVCWNRAEILKKVNE